MEDRYDLLGGAEPGPGVNELRTIVAKANRRRLRFASGGMAAALGVGGLVGYAVSNHGSSKAVQTASGQTANGSNDSTGSSASSPQSPGFASGSSGGGVASAPMQLNGPKLTHLSTRTVGDITVQLFSIPTFSPPKGMPNNACFADFGPRLQFDVSTPKMAAQGEGLFGARGVESIVLGAPEGDPVGVVAFQTTSQVANVKMAFTGGARDSMAPDHGAVALVGHVTGARANFNSVIGQVTTFASSGAQIGTATLRWGGFATSTLNGAVAPTQPKPCATCAPKIGRGVIGVGGSTQKVIRPAIGAPTVGSSSGAVSSSGTAIACPMIPGPPLQSGGASSGPPATVSPANP